MKQNEKQTNKKRQKIKQTITDIEKTRGKYCRYTSTPKTRIPLDEHRAEMADSCVTTTTATASAAAVARQIL